MIHRLPPSLVLLAVAMAGSAGGETFKIALTESGVYRVGYEDLASAGLAGRPDSTGLALTSQGRAVPIWVQDGGDGVFGPGDWLEFVGRRLTGEGSFDSEYATSNTYWLTTGAGETLRMSTGSGLDAGLCSGAQPPLTVRRHWEENNLRVRFSSQQEHREDPWFWAKLTHLDSEPFVLPLEADALDSDSPLPVTLRAHLRGWSSLPRELAAEADHSVELLLDGRTIDASTWDNGPAGELLEVRLPASALAGDSTLALRVPPLRLPPRAEPAVDVVLLDWVEIAYPRGRRLDAPQTTVWLGDERTPCIEFSSPAADRLVLYAEEGRHRVAVDTPQPGPEHRFVFATPTAGQLELVLGGALRSPDAIAIDEPSDLRSVDHQADYVMIAHPTLLAAVEPLAEFHRRRGLSVVTVSVDDVFDEFNHGVAHPRAIKDFLRYATSRWQSPGPRFVLLVGDATWDRYHDVPDDASYADWTFSAVPGVDFAKNRVSTYADGTGRHERDLVPTWSYGTLQGYAASDNWFVAFDDDALPALAIGRFPVATAEEVTAIVDKTIGYASESAPAAWRSRVLLITNEEEAQQRRSDRLAANLERAGFEPTKIYPAEDEATNQLRTESLLAAFEEGYFLVHFSGHGGRYIWRTGASDYKKNRDLFTLEHLDQLAPAHPLPIVLSMTCYSAPFDHPSADSIGEKLLRMADKGAVAVIAASWRNGASLQMSEALIDEVTQSTTLGEALQRAKRRAPLTDFVNLYNLLGDPALPIAPPPHGLTPARPRADRALTTPRRVPLWESL